MLVLSIYVLIALFRHRFSFAVEISALLRTLDTIICFVSWAIFHRLYRRNAGWRS